MLARIAFCLLLGFAMSPSAAADQPTFSSSEMIKERIDTAMPGILKRDVEAMQRFVEDLMPAEKVAAQMPGLAPQFKAATLTEVDWRYLGVKKLGSIYRQFAYICRYDRGVCAWRFDVVEREGRWVLLNVQFDGKTDDLMEEKAAGNEQCVQLCDKIAGMGARGDRDLIDLIKERFVPHDKACDQDLEAGARALRAHSILGNGLLKCERIRSRELEEILGQYQYVVQWKEDIAILNIQCYHVGKQWRLSGFTATCGTCNLEPMFVQAAWEPPTRQAVKPQDETLK
ncbi:MAG: hypothetical protein ACLQNE_03660 [Thermoguttaceae bacterium]